jgi:thioredoxin 1
MRHVFPAALLSLAVLSLGSPTLLAKPPVFSDTPFAQARDATKGSPKLLIVKATASWCAPCKRMDKTTWVDEKVVAWVRDNGVAIEFDVDEQKELSKQLKIDAMPTMIAFKDGAEFDRTVGYKDAEDLLAWLSDVKGGVRSIDKLAEKAKAAPDADEDEDVDVDAKYEYAQALVSKGSYEEAAAEYVWLWKNMLKYEPSMSGVRGSFMAGDMERLAARSEPAKQQFIKLRDEAEQKLNAKPSRERSRRLRDDWIVLNGVVADDARTLAWFDEVRKNTDADRVLDDFGFRLENLLIKHNRWADLAAVVKDPIAKIREDHELVALTSRPIRGADEDMQKQVNEMASQRFRDGTARLYAGLLAAGREGDAAALAEEARKLDPAPEMVTTLIEMALESGNPRDPHADWLKELAVKGHDVAQVQQRFDAAKKSGQSAK